MLKLLFVFIIFLASEPIFAQLHYTTNFREDWIYNTLTKEKTLVSRKNIVTSIVCKDNVFQFNPADKLLLGCALQSKVSRDKDGTLIMNVQGTDGYRYLLKISEKHFILVCSEAIKGKIAMIKYGITKTWIDK